MHLIDSPCESVLDLIEKTAGSDQRILIGIAGPPGAGKTTLAEDVVQQLNDRARSTDRAALLPMDGFHLDNYELKQRGLLARKGAPETFDATGLVKLLGQVKAHYGDVHYPLFDRARDQTVLNGGRLKAETSVVVVEGNYLLLNRPIWEQLAGLFDATVFINPSLETLERRLVSRWLGFGFSAEEATRKAHGNDLKNARLVLDHSVPADLTLHETANEQ